MNNVEKFSRLTKVIANPSADHPSALTEGVWLAAKELQGHPLSLERMERVGATRERLDADLIHGAVTMKRIRERVRACAQKMGFSGPAPLILKSSTPNSP